MQLKEFSVLEQIAQQEMVLDDGIYLSSRLFMDYTVLLFQLNSFYVELFYPKDKDKCVIIKGFEDTHDLEPYLKRIDIAPLLSNI
ncbi:hypothetical protein [Flavisolibacter tropicus]|uniref:Uncharacterized protein n=1 Tax=Flavisolibacter tropicus TaxID=1492898 RepID=A0A172U1Q7_9BACT|nr:hypothetical protein [Flavisolibacter tropicus]ANE52937.1 hypothetical protein SY85_23125 [Flavisolibacter tropicus]